MTHEEWLEWRRQGVGASDAPAIMGVSPWSTPYQTWRNKIMPRKSQDSSSMKRGRDLEPRARAEFEMKIGSFVYPTNVENEELPWLRASLDGLCKENRIMVEIKCPNRADHALALEGLVPEKYWPQCQHQLLVTGLPSMFYWSFDGSNGSLVKVDRDNDYLENMLLPELKRFWFCVASCVSPPLTTSDVSMLDCEHEWSDLLEKCSRAI